MSGWLNKAAMDFDAIMRGGHLDGIIVYDLIQSYKFVKEDEEEGELKEAMRKVIRYYLSDYQYEEFKKEVGIES